MRTPFAARAARDALKERQPVWHHVTADICKVQRKWDRGTPVQKGAGTL